MGLVQALDTVLEAARICAATVPDAQFVFVGGGVDKARLEQRAAEMQLPNALFLPRQPVEAVGGILSLADAALVHLKDDPLFRITIPSKTQAYLALGRPVLMAVAGDAAALVARIGRRRDLPAGKPRRPGRRGQAIADDGSPAAGGDGRQRQGVLRRAPVLARGAEKFERVFQAAVAPENSVIGENSPGADAAAGRSPLTPRRIPGRC